VRKRPVPLSRRGAGAPLQRLRLGGRGLLRRGAGVVERARAQRKLRAQRQRVDPVPVALQAAHQVAVLRARQAISPTLVLTT